MDSFILALSLGGLWTQWIVPIVTQWIVPIVMFIVGLGVVVFAHELGHFLLAKAVGIRVDRFALGMGKRLFGFRKGETDYCICAFPIGGYVAMKGQEDFKPDAPIDDDPQSFHNKSVGARFLVIAAGVVMNVILAAVLFVAVCLVGINFPAAVVGNVSPGFPASEAEIAWTDTPTIQPTPTEGVPPAVSTGLEGGDRILKIQGGNLILDIVGSKVVSFSDVALIAILADPEDEFTFTIEREVDGQKRIGKARIGVKSLYDGERLVFGVQGAASNVLDAPEDYSVGGALQRGDEVVRIDGRDVRYSWEIRQIERSLTGKEITLTVNRDGRKEHVRLIPSLTWINPRILWNSDGSRIETEATWRNRKEGTVTARFPDGTEKTWNDSEIAGGYVYELLDIVGLIPRLQVEAVERSFPADKAGLQPGDVIVGYGDQGPPTFRRLQQINESVEGSGTNMVLLRAGETKTVWVVPKSSQGVALIGISPGVDLENLVVGGVRQGSPAERGGIPPGARITGVNGQAVENWTDLFNALKANQDRKVSLSYQVGEHQGSAEIPSLTQDVFDPDDYDFALFTGPMGLRILEVRITEKNPFKAIFWGCGQTVKWVLSNYLSLRALLRGTVSAKSISGPLGIGKLAVEVARRGPVKFVYFMAFISAALAVFNFLPLPVMDGGHAALLLIEKIRRKPLPPKWMVGIQVSGWVLLLSLFVALTWNDIAKML